MSNDNYGKEVILSVKHVDISFDTGHKKKFVAVKDANFDIYKGETFALVGESGSGKTTLGRAILRINPCSAGEILFEVVFPRPDDVNGLSLVPEYLEAGEKPDEAIALTVSVPGN